MRSENETMTPTGCHSKSAREREIHHSFSAESGPAHVNICWDQITAGPYSDATDPEEEWRKVMWSDETK
ncbi:hypothetical protein CHARACLAT_010401 [Characodon lateralis]|uniref:Uncharacterized protein n=1 Tax=Characodon lateralis TaxID=208331 RepID=A0ABU7EHZ3_9TELE|nr:hypothetical protein [Characodon lateralis]